MRLGKLTNEQLESLILRELNRCARREVVQGAGIGEDCCAVELDGDLCVLSTDPITAAASDAAALAIQVSVNDVAASGAQPVAVLLTVLAPPEAELSDLQALMQSAAARAARENVQIIGGHTEVTDAVRRVVVSATVLGRVSKSAFIKSSGARPGDDLVMTKFAGLEGTLLLARDRADRLLALGLTRAELDAAADLLESLSVGPDGRVAASFGANAMHDATEGGILGAAWEMAAAGGLSVHIRRDRIPVLPLTRRIAGAFSLDPLRLIASGSMLIAHPRGEELVAVLAREGIPAAVIGSFGAAGRSTLEIGDSVEPLAPPAGDEFYKSVFENESEKN